MRIPHAISQQRFWPTGTALALRLIGLLSLISLSLGLSTHAFAQSTPVALTNFSYFDSYSKTMVPGTRMILENGKISAINDDTYPCAGCDTYDLGGGFVLPGLIDAHQHLDLGGFSRQSASARVAMFRRDLYWGITTAFNPSLPTDVMAMLRAAVAKNPENYPRFLTAGRHIGPKNGWGDLKTATIGGLKAAIDAQINANVSVIQISFEDKAWLTNSPLPMFSAGALETAIRHAHMRERRVFVYTNQVQYAKHAARAGADAIISGLIVGDVDAELISLMKTNRTGYVATLSAFHTIADAVNAAQRQKAYDPDMVNGKGIYLSMGSPIMAQNWRDWWPLSDSVPARLRTLNANTKRLIDSGVTVGVGTDAGTPGVIFGSSFADEVAYHTELGLRPAEAILLATQGSARLLSLDQVTGTINVGKAADLVVVRSDPLASVDALKTIAYVVRAGRLYDRRTFTDAP